MKSTRLNTAVRRALAGLELPWRGRSLVCALSGGADSVALTDALAAAAARHGFTLLAAHLDHGLRPRSADDAAFCAALCERLGVRLVAARADVRESARRGRLSIEEAARAERYAFLRRVARDERAVAIAVAHTQDDQAETLLLRLLRGAGGVGLAAMRVRSGELIRPLLAVSRAEVLAHLHARGLAWREDESNRDLAVRRNRVRHELIPYLERHFNPRLRRALCRTADLLAAEQGLLERLAAAAPLEADACVRLCVLELREAPEALSRIRIRKALAAAGGLRGVSERHVEAILRLARRPDGSGRSVSLPGDRAATVSFGSLRIGPRRKGAAGYAFPLSVPGRVELPDGQALVAEPAAEGAVSETAGHLVRLPEGPLEVRTRRPGDRVRVRGRAQSLKRYLIARRVPAEERCRLPLVAAGREVLWMPDQPLSGAGERRVRLHLESA